MKVERLKLLSYSYSGILHLCPKRYEIDQSWPVPNAKAVANEESLQGIEDAINIPKGNVDFAFGHAVHAGVQRLFLDDNIQVAIWEAFKAWDIPLYDTHKSKSFWTALDAIHKAQVLVANLKAEGWEVVKIKGKDSIEINFLIHLINGYKYQGHIDLILQNKLTKEFKVFEIKTTVFTMIDEAMFGNSNQPLGYSVIVDTIAPNQVNYEVVYLIWSEAKYGRQWHIMSFLKSRTQKAEWIRDVMGDVDQIERYKQDGHFPKRGESCYAFFRRCPYFGTCSLPLKALIPNLAETKELTDEKYRGQGANGYDFEFSLEQIIANQLEISEM